MEVYLDNSATTMCYPEVGELVYHIMCRDYGNPSAMYRKGMEAERYIKEAKETISKLLKVNAKEIIFTSGGTESDNQALIGMFPGLCVFPLFSRKTGSAPHFHL